MSNSRDLLKEAIADAKSVKEAAIANAKAALEEAFTPYLQEKFAAKLAEMELEEDEMQEAEMTDENYGEDLKEKMSNPIMRHGLKGDGPEEIETEEDRYKGIDGDKIEEELDLEELLAELEEEERTKGMEKKTEESLTEAEEEEEMEMDSEEEVEGEDKEVDLDEMSEEDLKALIEDVIADMVAAGELEAGENYEEEEGDEEEEEVDFEEEDEESEEEEIMERKNYGGGKGDESKDKGAYAKKKEGHGRGPLKKDSAEAEGKTDYRKKLKEEEMVDEIDAGTMADLSSYALQNSEEVMAMAIAGILGISAGSAFAKELAQKAINALKGKKATNEAEVEEMRVELEELASTLSEVKLLNAKLLYTNKIFRAKNLNETQKVKVLEAFDKASSVKEAKLIYETLTTVKETKTAVTESMRGMASKAVGIAPEKKPILEVNDQFARWQILAGIKRN